MISSSNSLIALSTMGFLLGFLVRPSSKRIPLSTSGCVVNRDLNAGAESDLTVDSGAPCECRGVTMEIIPSTMSAAFSDFTKVAHVYEVTVSRETRMNCFARRKTSIENTCPIRVGASDVEKGVICFGRRFTVAHLWQQAMTSPTFRSMSKQAKFLLKRSFNWWAVGWPAFM